MTIQDNSPRSFSGIFTLTAWIAVLMVVSYIAGEKIMAADDTTYVFRVKQYQFGDEAIYINQHFMRMDLLAHPFYFVAAAPSWKLFAVCAGTKTYCDLSKTEKFVIWPDHERRLKPPQNITYKGVEATRSFTIPRSNEGSVLTNKNHLGLPAMFPPKTTDRFAIVSTEVVRERSFHFPDAVYNAINRIGRFDPDAGVPLSITHNLTNGKIGIALSFESVEKFPTEKISPGNILSNIPKDYKSVEVFNDFLHGAVLVQTNDIFEDLKVGDPFGSASKIKKIAPTSPVH